MIVDFEGRILAQADAGPGEKIVVASIDIDALRAERQRRTGHHMLSHLRTETYQQAHRPIYPGSLMGEKMLTIQTNEKAIRQAKSKAGEQK
jgi:hypothetical protein